MLVYTSIQLQWVLNLVIMVTKSWYDSGLVAKYERGFLSIWQVSNWTSGTEVVENGAYTRAYGRGNFHYGLEVQGTGLVIQDIFEDVRVSVTRDGTVYKN